MINFLCLDAIDVSCCSILSPSPRWKKVHLRRQYCQWTAGWGPRSVFWSLLLLLSFYGIDEVFISALDVDSSMWRFTNRQPSTLPISLRTDRTTLDTSKMHPDSWSMNTLYRGWDSVLHPTEILLMKCPNVPSGIAISWRGHWFLSYWCCSSHDLCIWRLRFQPLLLNICSWCCQPSIAKPQ